MSDTNRAETYAVYAGNTFSEPTSSRLLTHASLISGEAAELPLELGSKSECWDREQSETVSGAEDEDHETEKHSTAGEDTEEAQRRKTPFVFALCESVTCF